MISSATSSGSSVFRVGQVVRVRTRTYLVESVEPSPGTGTLVRMACLDDDTQGQPLEVVWELELGPEILDREAWQSIGRRGFDETFLTKRREAITQALNMFLDTMGSGTP